MIFKKCLFFEQEYPQGADSSEKTARRYHAPFSIALEEHVTLASWVIVNIYNEKFSDKAVVKGIMPSVEYFFWRPIQLNQYFQYIPKWFLNF